ncbi:sensor histidine kinase [Actinophytocola sp. NPDC049390]|uniref:sensor histidine kinase n=1 Tax=Actinophytocola sp. NPDC049390 TaxID=3363894 RepID=UPI00379F13CE
MESVTEIELRRLGRRYAVLVRTAVLVCACAAGSFQNPGWAVAIAVVALGSWTAVYARHSSRRWLLPADTSVVVALCFTQRWVVPPDSLSDSTNWVLAIVSITVVAHQWFTTMTGAVLLTTAVTSAHLLGVLLAAPELWADTVLIGLWTFAEAALSRVLFLLVRTGARRADRAVAATERARRAAAVAAARRADEREHLAVLHDTAAATLLAVGAHMVDGSEPWLSRQAARDLEALAAHHTLAADHSAVDLVAALHDVTRDGPVRVTWQALGAVPLPTAPAAAITAAAREALTNVARHAGVDTATVTVARANGTVTVEITDHGHGFAPGRVSPHRRGVSGSIEERMTRAGGRATVTTSPGAGTRVRLEWPHD